MAASHFQQKLQNLCMKAGFDPDQPRIPAGSTEGGRWSGETSVFPSRDPGRLSTHPAPMLAETGQTYADITGQAPWRRYTEQHHRDGSLAIRTIENRDGSRIETWFSSGARSVGNRSTVVLSDGTTFRFENRGGLQKIYDREGRPLAETEWGANGPTSQPMVIPATLGIAVQTRQLMEAGRLLYNSVVEFGDYLGSVLAFRAWDHDRTDADAELTFSGEVSRDRVEEFCPALPTVQALTDEAARQAGDPASYPSAAVYGTAVHTRLRDMVRELRNPKLTAELSIMKRREEPLTTLGSIRIDVVETRDDGTICVFDIKTGRRGLSTSRISEFVERFRNSIVPPSQVIVIEIRPFE